MKYLTLIQWQDAAGQFHEVGTAEALDAAIVTDIADLLRSGTLEPVNEPVNQLLQKPKQLAEVPTITPPPIAPEV